MKYYETELNDYILNELIILSKEWEEENSTRGYFSNKESDIKGNRIFIAEDNKKIIGYLFGKIEVQERDTTVYKKSEKAFEVAELFVKKEYRSKGIGKELFEYTESVIRKDVDIVLLSTATKDYKKILHFYIDIMGMEFWSARLFKRF